MKSETTPEETKVPAGDDTMHMFHVCQIKAIIDGVTPGIAACGAIAPVQGKPMKCPVCMEMEASTTPRACPGCGKLVHGGTDGES